MIESTARRTLGARTGGRSERVVREVMRAAIAELSQSGYGALRVEDVATRAGVNKTTIYRRWPTKAELVVSAIRAFAGHQQPLPDTGTTRGDLVELLGRAIAFARTAEGSAVTRLITVESGDPEVDRLCRALREGLFEQRGQIIERGQRRGELPSGLDVRIVLDAIFVPVITRVLRYREDVSPATAEAFVDLALAGAVHGKAAAKPS